MLPIVLSKNHISELMSDCDDGKELTVDLRKEEIIRADGRTIQFTIDSFRRRCLLEGLDDIGLTLLKSDIIKDFETRRRSSMPWFDNAAQPFTT